MDHKAIIETLTHRTPSGLCVEAPLTSYAYLKAGGKNLDMFEAHTKSGDIVFLISKDQENSGVAELFLNNYADPQHPDLGFYPEVYCSHDVRDILSTQDHLSDMDVVLDTVVGKGAGGWYRNALSEASLVPETQKIQMTGEYNEPLKAVVRDFRSLVVSGKFIYLEDMRSVTCDISDNIVDAPQVFFNDMKGVLSDYARKNGFEGRSAEIAGACLTSIITISNSSVSPKSLSVLPDVLGLPDASTIDFVDTDKMADLAMASEFARSAFLKKTLGDPNAIDIDMTEETIRFSFACGMNLTHATMDGQMAIGILSMSDDNEYMRSQNAKMVLPDHSSISDGVWCGKKRMDILRAFDALTIGVYPFEDRMANAVVSSTLPVYTADIIQAMTFIKNTELVQDLATAYRNHLVDVYASVLGIDAQAQKDCISRTVEALQEKQKNLYAASDVKEAVQHSPGL